MERERSDDTSGQGGLDSIKIYCRFAPMSSSEEVKTLNHSLANTGHGARVSVKDDYNGSTLDMDCELAFDGNTTQQVVHEQVTEPLIPRLLQGYNCTLLAFGQTASGKTHTMLGPQGGRYDFMRKDQNCGIVPRAVLSLFEHIESSGTRADVDFSYFEIYNEVVSDLIAKATHCDGNGKSFVFRGTDKARFEREVSRVRVKCADEFLHILEATNANRQQGGTDLNQVSSRSHSVVLLRVHTKTTSATMCMVDLAGSECIKKSNAQGLRRYETKNINTSLFALKQVIHALYKRKEHVPYADSMLTRTLSDSLSGNAYISILVCCTSRAEDAQETMTTLRFAKEASCVVRKAPAVNRYDLSSKNQLVSSAEVEQLAAERAALLAEKGEMSARMEQSDNETAVLRMQVRQLQETNTQLINQLHQGTVSHQGQLAAVQARNEELEAQAAVLKDEEERTAEQNIYLSKKVTEVQKHMEGILCQIKQVTIENDTLRSELRQNRAELDGSRPAQQPPARAAAAAAAGTAPSASASMFSAPSEAPQHRYLQQEVNRCQHISEELNKLKMESQNERTFPSQANAPPLRPAAAAPSLFEPLITAEQDALTARLQRLEQVFTLTSDTYTRMQRTHNHPPHQVLLRPANSTTRVADTLPPFGTCVAP